MYINIDQFKHEQAIKKSISDNGIIFKCKKEMICIFLFSTWTLRILRNISLENEGGLLTFVSMFFRNELIEMASLTSTFHKFHCFTASGINEFPNNCNLHLGIINIIFFITSVVWKYVFTFLWDNIKQIFGYSSRVDFEHFCHFCNISPGF